MSKFITQQGTEVVAQFEGFAEELANIDLAVGIDEISPKAQLKIQHRSEDEIWAITDTETGHQRLVTQEEYEDMRRD